MALEEGKVYSAHVDSYASDGTGVARIHGMVVFVHGAIAGEDVEVCIEHVGHNAAWAHIATLRTPSPARMEPDCPHYDTCGGCQFRHMTYEEELHAKRQRVEDALHRLGGLDVPVSAIHGAQNIYGYRNKVQFPVSWDGIGYYRSRTHQVIDIPHCHLQPQVDSVCRQVVADWMKQYHIPPYQEKTGKGLVRHLYLRTNQAGQVLCCLIVNGHKLPHSQELVEALQTAVPSLVGVVLSVNTKKTNVILGTEYHTLWGQDWLEETLCGHTFRLSVPSFFQINQPQTQVLYARAVEFAGLTGAETVVDLYCGIGTISLTMAEHGAQVIGVEVVPQAIEDAKENARRNGLADKTRFLCGDASQLALQLEQEGVPPDVVVVDPPRKGLAPDVVDTIARMAPPRVVYVSCDPATLGRDLKRFAALGYVAQRAEAVDLFPRTAHIETVVRLDRKSAEHFMNLYAQPFQMIKSGRKTIELRLWDEKRQNIKIGDTIIFTNTTDGEKLEATVLNLHRFNSFQDLYQALPLLKCGYIQENVHEAKASDMDVYYSKEEQEKYGVVGIEISLSTPITDSTIVSHCKT